MEPTDKGIEVVRFYDENGVNRWSVIDNRVLVSHDGSMPTMAMSGDVSFVVQKNYYTKEQLKSYFPDDQDLINSLLNDPR